MGQAGDRTVTRSREVVGCLVASAATPTGRRDRAGGDGWCAGVGGWWVGGAGGGQMVAQMG